MSEFKKDFKLYFLSFLLAVNFLIWYAVFDKESNLLEVAFLDVGQGDAIFIETPSKKQILIDGGKNKAVLRELGKVMPFYDRTIDFVILTHPDEDHIAGLIDVLNSYNVKTVLDSGVADNGSFYKEFNQIIEEEGIEKELAKKGMVFDFGDGAFMEVLYPDRNVADFENNSASVVAKLSYGNNSFLFTGDLPKNLENYLVASFGEKLDVDVLKLGHHGSRTSTSETFLGFVSPAYAVASVGLSNKYMHPHKEVVDLLESFGVDLLRTDEQGRVVFRSDGERVFSSE